MKTTRFFSVLETVSSEVGKISVFTTGIKIYVLDFFIIFLFATLFCLSVVLDVIVVFFIFFYETNLILGISVMATVFPRIICEFLVEKKTSEGYLPNLNLDKFQIILNLLGLRSILVSVRSMSETITAERTSVKSVNCQPFSVFHISNENFSLIKIYCCVSIAVKSIPQFFIFSILLLQQEVLKSTAFVTTTNIALNIVLFSLTISLTFPIRKSPRVFTTCVCLIFSAINKYMATMCACCISLAIFAALFKDLRYHALWVHFLRSVVWIWPCWRVLRSQPVLLPKFYFGIYLFFMILVFGFVYIHPFEGQGKLYYYFFYLLNILLDLAVLYICTDPNLEIVTCYFTLRILMIGFLSCFGLLNILHKYKEIRYGCMSYSSVKSGETGSNENVEEENIVEIKKKDQEFSFSKEDKEDKDDEVTELVKEKKEEEI